METVNKKRYLDNGLSEALTKYATREDLSDIQKETGVSVSTLIGIRRQEGVVTERSQEAVNKLAKRAYKNAEASEREAKKCKKSLQSFIDCI
ncbi:hypothetical protein [Chryseobacterium vrystaatense]|uniref:Uncharacterized protein n=1 Tax=Chryseobacterium vrystaatense TaxID=307480 RepID=A0A1M4ZFS7_9FLAO|nr:hypothetical protein [Chryseobacterium vrystaatense]SHF16642.1 hypothetical protein SAMN02787073_1580 [Chryseobacterium vrystaatense]